MTLVVLIYWPPPSKVEIAISGVARIVLSDVFFASIFVAYVEPKLFFAYARENSPVQPLTVETIMVGSNLTILDQIAKFFLLLFDAPLY